MAIELIEMLQEFFMPAVASTVGDSGSPVVARHDNGNHTVVGMLSIAKAKNRQLAAVMRVINIATELYDFWKHL